MIKQIKSTGLVVSGLAVGVVIMLVTIFLINSIVALIENNQGLIKTVDVLLIGLIFIMLILSVIPRLRGFTGTVIYYGTILWIFTLWLNCLGVTYEIWGMIGIFIGVIMIGLGIFATAFLALLFSGSWIEALILLLTLGIMYGLRYLGLWLIMRNEERKNNLIYQQEESEDSQLTLFNNK